MIFFEGALNEAVRNVGGLTSHNVGMIIKNRDAILLTL